MEEENEIKENVEMYSREPSEVEVDRTTLEEMEKELRIADEMTIEDYLRIPE